VNSIRLKSHKFAALENFYDNVSANRASESIRENMKASAVESPDYYELKQHKPCFDEEC